MIYSTRGVVFRTVKFSETSVIASIYTEKFGMQSYIVNGIRSSKSKTRASLLLPMSWLDLQVYHRENKKLNRIREMQSHYLYRTLLFDPLRGSLGLFLVEVLYQCIREEEANETLFEFIVQSFMELDQAAQVAPDFLLHFLLGLSGHLGFYPSGAYDSGHPDFDLMEGRFSKGNILHPYFISPPLSQAFSDCLHRADLKFPAEIRRKLLRTLLEYFQLHVPNFSRPRSLQVLQEVFQR